MFILTLLDLHKTVQKFAYKTFFAIIYIEKITERIISMRQYMFTETDDGFAVTKTHYKPKISDKEFEKNSKQMIDNYKERLSYYMKLDKNTWPKKQNESLDFQEEMLNTINNLTNEIKSMRKTINMIVEERDTAIDMIIRVTEASKKREYIDEKHQEKNLVEILSRYLNRN